MLHHLHRLRRWAGVDRAVFFSNAAQMLRLVTGPITMALVLRYLTPEIQGYYYAFAGVVAMQVFLEMGFSQNILQFASHEYAKLHLTPAGTLAGDVAARSRLISLGRLAFGYYAIAAVVVLLGIGIGGHVFFGITSTSFSADSFKEMPAFAKRLETQSDLASKFLYENLSPDTRQALRRYQADKSNLKALQKHLSKDLNLILSSGSLYKALQNAGVKVSLETTQVQEQQPKDNALKHRNRLLLERTFPQNIMPAVAWQGAWWIIAVTAALALAINPAWSLLQGCNQVAVVAKFNFWAALASFSANAIALVSGAGIYASAIGAACTLLVSVSYLVVRWRAFFSQFLEQPQHGCISWAQEIWPFQWRIAVSWMSGYFVFDILNPIAFYFCGPVAAGRLGISLQLVNTIARVALTWVTTKGPRFGMLIAARSWSELDALWRRSTLQVFVFYILGYASFLIMIPVVGQFLPMVPARLAPFPVNAWLGGALVTQVLIGAMAMELRAHKREPFMWVSAATAILSVAFILPLVHLWGITGEAIGYALALWSIFIPSCKIYRVKRLEYRSEAEALHKPPTPFAESGLFADGNS